jgi:hypothetical protein
MLSYDVIVHPFWQRCESALELKKFDVCVRQLQ